MKAGVLASKILVGRARSMVVLPPLAATLKFIVPRPCKAGRKVERGEGDAEITQGVAAKMGAIVPASF